MKRVLLALLGLFLTTVAQGEFRQSGMASQEFQVEGMVARHTRLMPGSKARVTNTANGKTIEVTIVGRIPESSENRIIDLSPEAARALDIDIGGRGSVDVQVPDTPRSASVAAPGHEPASPPSLSEPEMEQVAAATLPSPSERSVAKTEPKPAAPINITIYNYLSPSDTQKQEPAKEQEAREPQAVRPPEPTPPTVPPPTVLPSAPPPVLPIAPPPTAPPPVLPIVPPPVYTPPPVQPVTEVQVTPGLPPYSDKLYNLQVGAFSTEDGAFRAYSLVKAAGFDAFLEQTGNVFRVLAVGIPAQSVYYAAQRLGTFGFSHIWVRE